jgi:serine/threonine protein kinase
MDRYERVEKNTQLGEGTYGVVYKARDRQSNKFVALKVGGLYLPFDNLSLIPLSLYTHSSSIIAN